MTTPCLSVEQNRTVQIISALGFGVIHGLLICAGSPSYDPEPHIVQTIKLSCDVERKPGPDNAGLTLKKEFKELFSQLRRIQDGIVDIEVRHGLPFRHVLERRCTEFVAGEKKS